NPQEHPLAEEEAKRKAEEEARRKAEEQRLAEEEAKRKAEEEARRKAEEQRLAEEEAKRKAEEEARRKAEEQRLAEEEAKRKAEEEQKRKIKLEAISKEEQQKAQQQVAVSSINSDQPPKEKIVLNSLKKGINITNNLCMSTITLAKKYIKSRQEKAKLREEQLAKFAETTEILEREKIAFLKELQNDHKRELRQKEKEIARFKKKQDRFKKELTRRNSVYKHSSIGTYIKIILFLAVIVGIYFAFQKYSSYIPDDWLKNFK
ncbi:hypothetical protein P8822_00005, partial [Bacillus sonorensis]